MNKIELVKNTFLLKGIAEDNIDYAIEAVRSGAKREHIKENLTADYRGMNEEEAKNLLDELFLANGGEYKFQNRLGYLYGVFALLIGLPCTFYIIYVFLYGGILVRPVIVIAAAIGFTGYGIYSIAKAIMGKYREKDTLFSTNEL